MPHRVLSTAAIIPAAGLGLRLGGQTPKALRRVGGEPLLVHAARGLTQAAVGLSHLVVAVPEGAQDAVGTLLGPHCGTVEVICVVGGAVRTDSVRAALDALPDHGYDCVLVHDAARPFVPATVIRRVVAAVLAGAVAVVPVVAVTDTIKRVTADGRVVGTPDRAALVAVQTPQGFRPTVLQRAYAEAVAAGPATDDAALVERLGLPVDTVEGSPDSAKVTLPRDLVVAEAILAERRRSAERIGS